MIIKTTFRLERINLRHGQEVTTPGKPWGQPIGTSLTVGGQGQLEAVEFSAIMMDIEEEGPKIPVPAEA